MAGGQTITLESHTYQRLWSRVDERRARLGGLANARVLDLESGKDINITHAEDAAFWQWAIVEVLRRSGVRVEEALELTHISIRPYQRPNGEVIALLVVAPSKGDRERVIPMSAELFAVIAAIVRRHTASSQTTPLLPRDDPRERQSSESTPFLFQRKIATKHEVMSDTTVVNMLKRHCVELAEQHPGSLPPASPRSIFADSWPRNWQQRAPDPHRSSPTRTIESSINSWLRRRVYEDVVRRYQGFLDRRRQARPTDEYRPATEPEWLDFEEHFDQRKVELGGCARPYATPCQHEHACLRCPMININPKMLPRLDEIEDDLLTRRARAGAEGWLGEIKGIDPTLSFLRQKRDQTRRLARVAPVDLGIPGIAPRSAARRE